MSAFFLFSQSLREDIKKTGGSVSGVENIAKMAGHKWKEMSETQKKPFADKAVSERERYERDLASGLKPPPRKTKNVKKTNVKVKDPNKPKRVNSAYLFFSSDFRKMPEASSIKHSDMMKAAGTKWKDMSETDKKPYHDMEKKDKIRFQNEMESYNAKNPTASKKSPKMKAKKAAKDEPKKSESSESESDDDDGSEENEESDDN
uniref:High mobility group protein B1 (Trinotate prediction) n=1 Tax=Henneguya salminicola TaxID=69463 RepID=A0A6G3MHS8_HENSL